MIRRELLTGNDVLLRCHSARRAGSTGAAQRHESREMDWISLLDIADALAMDAFW